MGSSVAATSEQGLRAIDTAARILARRDISVLQCATSVVLPGTGAALLSIALPGTTMKPGGLASHVFAFRCGGARTCRADKPRDFPGRVGGPGMSIFLAAEEESVWECEGPHEVLTVFIGVDLLAHLAADAFETHSEAVHYQDSAFHYDRNGARLGRILAEQLRGEEPLSPLELDAWSQLIGLHVLRHYSSIGDRATAPVSGTLTMAKLRMTIDYMQDHLGLPLQLMDIAAAVGMTQYSFARAFRHTTGMSPHQYVIKLRLERAQQLLASDKLPISHIADVLGFADQSHLTKLFRKEFGTTPARYRCARSETAYASSYPSRR